MSSIIKQRENLFHYFQIVTFLVTFLISEGKPYSLAGQGESCDSTTQCNSSASLTCNNGACECILPDIMSFNGTKCTLLAGKKCTFTTVHKNRNDENGIILTEELPCITNSTCTNGYCTCASGLYESLNGTCLQKLGYGESCESDLQCNTDLNLACGENKRCDCNTNSSTFDIYKQSCSLLAGMPCEEDSDNNLESCITRAVCKQNFCQCEPSFFANLKGLCEKRREYNMSCLNDSYCKFGYICGVEKRCTCNETISIFDPKQKTCLQLVGTDYEGRLEYSVPNSECRSPFDRFTKDAYYKQKCTCSNDYFQTLVGLCQKKGVYGTPCHSDDECEGEGSRKKFKCGIDGLCGCAKSWQIYDPKQQTCVSLVDEPCGNCVFKAECNSETNECSCVDDYIPSENGTCLAPYGERCGKEWTMQCNENQGTICSGGLCICKYDKMQVFDKTVRKCLSLVNGPCNDILSCVDNAHCSNETESGLQQCVCNSGFVPVDGQCQLSHGESCEYSYNFKHQGRVIGEGSSAQKCDRLAQLQCIEGKCGCNKWEHYDTLGRKCRGLVGAFCIVNVANYCIVNATCLESTGVCGCETGFIVGEDKLCKASETGEIVVISR
ncbi:unnamed protein product [Orchesella dallaii]|uniref:EGF-like domain-containing protein n=1 Tax=Orchesella dallaii TaxID=48710 RepID=A0ABP1S4B2_9HEXA